MTYEVHRLKSSTEVARNPPAWLPAWLPETSHSLLPPLDTAIRSSIAKRRFRISGKADPKKPFGSAHRIVPPVMRAVILNLGLGFATGLTARPTSSFVRWPLGSGVQHRRKRVWALGEAGRRWLRDAPEKQSWGSSRAGAGLANSARIYRRPSWSRVWRRDWTRSLFHRHWHRLPHWKQPFSRTISLNHLDCE